MHPVLLELPFGVPLYSYGTMLLLAVLSGRLVALQLAERAGIRRDLADRCALWTLIGAIAGARLLWVVTNIHQPSDILAIAAVWKGGLVVYGGFLGGLAGAIACCRKHRLPLLTWADCVAPSLGLGLAIGRLGCFLGGCDFGQPWNGAWAVQFPPGSPASIEQARLGLLPLSTMASLPVHPTQLYESMAGVALLLLVAAVLRRRLRPGHALAAFAMGYAVIRYLIEILRADPGRGLVGPWSRSQFIAIVTFAAASTLLYVLRSGNTPRAFPSS